MSPIFTNACTKLAERAAMTISQASATLAPAPAATPFTAATTGNGSARSLRIERVIICLQRAAEHRRLPRLREPVVEILTRAKCPPGAGQKQCAAVRVLLGFNNRAFEGAVHGFVECIEALRTIERDPAIARVLLDQDGLFFHAKLLTDVCPVATATKLNADP
jgi:hypothetical protein